jgi:hypothetical protein
MEQKQTPMCRFLGSKFTKKRLTKVGLPVTIKLVKVTKDSQAKKPAVNLPPFKLTPPKPGDKPGVYTAERAGADWKMMEAYMEARGIKSGF